MSFVPNPVAPLADHLLLAGHVLSALETGRMRMHASDYREISSWVSDEFAKMDTATLCAMRGRTPASLHTIIDNTLVVRVDAAWSELASKHCLAETHWAALLKRLGVPA